MRKRAVAHLKGNIWYWTAGFGAAGVLAAMTVLEWRTTAAFLLLTTGILMIMADSHVDPLALITENALHPDEVAGSAGDRPRLWPELGAPGAAPTARG
jgi:hypothetical protein